MITDPAERRGSPPETEPRVGGAITFSGDPYAEADTTGTVLRRAADPDGHHLGRGRTALHRWS